MAVKVLHPAGSAGTSLPARFNRKARTVAGLSHPNIVAVHDVGTADTETKMSDKGRGKDDDEKNDEASTDAPVAGSVVKELELSRKTGAVQEIKLA
ncbi:hypothetical protein [Actinoplanes siamensis]|uniref:Uncharacterized protein n=1 Tax=Actinoplanes siamensis TaxID=1223317 RepID=A0A919NCM5_9ACTN|nr:hypothetical protein [Actinoplanes siamensis]GIF08416.1 hypothetical protein Asi03nite_59540 [Actinoplanes siamensis]